MTCKRHERGNLLALRRDEWDAATVACSCGFAGTFADELNHAEYLGRHRSVLTWPDGCENVTMTPSLPDGGKHVCQPDHSAYVKPRPPEVDCMYCGIRMMLNPATGSWDRPKRTPVKDQLALW
jgi:hypothetical protein